MIDLDAVPVADDARRLAEQRADGSTPLDHALSDGEDFELILAVPPDEAKRMLREQTPLRCRSPTSASSWPSRASGRSTASGVRRPLVPRGWQHMS